MTIHDNMLCVNETYSSLTGEQGHVL